MHLLPVPQLDITALSSSQGVGEGFRSVQRPRVGLRSREESFSKGGNMTNSERLPALTRTHRKTMMERFPQELIDEIIDRVDYADLWACSRVGPRWVERSHWRIWGSGYCSFIDRHQLYSVSRNGLFTNASILTERVHTLALNSSAVEAWVYRFRNADLVLPHLKSLVITDARLQLNVDVAVLKRNFGNALLSLSLNRVSIDSEAFYPILSSFPNLDDLSIVGLDISRPPSAGTVSACPRTQGRLTLVGSEVHDTCVPLLLKLPVRFHALYFYDVVGIGSIHPLVRTCAATLTTLEIRGTVFSPPTTTTALSPEKQTMCPAWVGPRRS